MPIVIGLCCQVGRQPRWNLCAIFMKSYAVYCAVVISQKYLYNKFINMNSSQKNANNQYHLPRLSLNESSYLKNVKKNQMNRSHSVSQNVPDKLQSQVNVQHNITRKLIILEDIHNIQEYENMNEKQLLRQHEKLLKVLKKFQQIIDISLQKKQKQRQKGKPQTSRQQVYQGEVNNNKKIIQNYQKQLKQLQNLKKCRKLHQVIQQKSQVQSSINNLKKQIFALKNEDTMAAKSLLTDRSMIQKQLKQHEKDLKTQLIKKQDYSKKLEQLTNQLNQLKKDCQNIPVNQSNNQKSHADNELLQMKKKQLQQVTKKYLNFQESIQQNIVAKARRNKNLSKQIQNNQKKIQQLNAKMQKYKQKILKYQQAMDIVTK